MSVTQAPITKDIIKEYLPENPIIIEAGAHIGRDTVKMATLWPRGYVHAFEPVPELFHTLKERTDGLPNVSCYQAALSDTIGFQTLHVSSGASTAASSLLEPFEYKNQRPNVLFHEITVQTITLDAWAEEHNIKMIDFLWLDMQGAELKALIGGTNLLKTAIALVMEVNLTERFKDNPNLAACEYWLNANGFKVIQQDIPKHNKINIFCIRSSYK